MTEPPVRPDAPALAVRNLSVEVATATGGRRVLDGLDFTLARGETLCLAGESGSGKSMTALALMGLLPAPMARRVSGEILLDGTDLARLSERRLRAVRAAGISMIFQEPMTSLNPIMTIGDQLGEVLAAHGAARRRELRARTVALLEDVRLTSPADRLRQYPHELSGGMRQRVMIAMALACDPAVLIADEPTTALDVTVQAEILALIAEQQAKRGTAVLLITHDMGVVAETADRVLVLRHGRMLEHAPVAELFAAPKHEYTRELLDAVPRLGTAGAARGADASDASAAPAADAPVASCEGLSVRFPVRGGGLLNRVTRHVHAVDDVSFEIRRGEIVSLVGESGSGKSTIGRALLSLVPFEGSVRIGGTEARGANPVTLKRLRRDVQMIFQDHYASLDPRMTVGEQIAEPLVVHGAAKGAELTDRVASLLERVDLSPDVASRHPHEFSGGQRQRICIARALSLGPKLIVADESVSALDVSVQARVLILLEEIRERDGVAFLFVSHDMAVVERVSDRVIVLRRGRIVESGTRDQVFGDPAHAYTRRLLHAVPIPDPDRRAERLAERAAMHAAQESGGDVIRAASGARAPAAPLTDLGGGHLVAA